MPPATIFIADSCVIGNKNGDDDAIKCIATPLPIGNKKELPALLGRAGRIHTDEDVDDILKTMLRDGKAPYGRVRQQYNYRYHARLADVAEQMIADGGTVDEKFRGRQFWREWSSKTQSPLSTDFYRRFA